MKSFTKALCLTAVVGGLLSSAHADTFRMKDGSKVEGTISLETEDSYIVLVEVKKGIRDQVTLKKSDVRYKTKSRVKKKKAVDRSKAQFEALKKLLPTANFLTEEDYDKLIATRIESLFTRFPDSAHKDIAIDTKVALLEEKARVAQGEVKFNGEWLTADQVTANQFEIDAAKIAVDVEKGLEKKDYPAALSALGKLQDGYKNTDIFHGLLDRCLDVAPLYIEQAQAIVTNHAEVVKKRDTKLARFSEGQRKKFQAKLQREENNYQLALEEAKESRSKWLPLNRFKPRDAQRAIKLAQREIQNLKSLKGESYTDASTTYRDLLVALEEGDIKTAESLSRQFSKARPPRKVSTRVRNLVRDAKKEARALKAAQRKAEAEERKRLQEEKRKAKEGAETTQEEEAADKEAKPA